MENNVTAPEDDSNMMVISSNEVDVGNSTSMALVKSINISHLDALPRIPDMTVNSSDSDDDSDKGPSLKETARSLRAKRNLNVMTGKHQHPGKRHGPRRHHHHHPSPSYSPVNNSDTNEPSENPLNEEIQGVDDGPSSKEATQLLGVPDASRKRQHSSSPVYQTKLGSKENPIDIESVASLFEPIMTRDYVRFFFLLLCLC
jgi:hypothetical protein